MEPDWQGVGARVRLLRLPRPSKGPWAVAKGRHFVVFLWEEEPGSESHCPHTMGLAETHEGKSPRLLRPNPDFSCGPNLGLHSDLGFDPGPSLTFLLQCPWLPPPQLTLAREESLATRLGVLPEQLQGALVEGAPCGQGQLKGEEGGGFSVSAGQQTGALG